MDPAYNQRSAIPEFRCCERCYRTAFKHTRRFSEQREYETACIDPDSRVQDLSELLGTTRVTVTRALIQLEQQGFIQRLSLQRIVLQQAEYWHYEI
ncbi:helix-turn-helix domain-containing protein [Leptolyngbya sp. 7M]|nr:helix-turn-helix domain-containing protein [Leptolyngbya sp. 7M]